jgi:hypothetical protein
MSFKHFQISGRITAIEQVVEFSENLCSKNYDTSADYAYDAALTLANTKLGMIDDFNVGDNVTVHFNPSSRLAKGIIIQTFGKLSTRIVLLTMAKEDLLTSY